MVDLKVDTSLLDSSFNGYKLSLDSLPIKTLSFAGANESKSSPDQYSMQHMQIFSEASPLFLDTFSSSEAFSVLFILKSDGNIVKLTYDIAANQWEAPLPVASVALVSSSASLPPSISLPAEDVAIVSDGLQNITLFRTTKDRNTWTQVHSFAPLDKEGFYLRDCRVRDDHVHLLLQTIYEHTERSKDDKAVFDLGLVWILLTAGADGTFSESARQVISLDSPVEMAAFDCECEHVIIVSSKAPRTASDTQSEQAIEQQDEDVEMEGENGESEKTAYIWAESGEEVSVLFHLDHKINKEDVHFEAVRDSIIVRVGSTTLLEGFLGGPINPANSVWTLTEKKSLEISLFKESSLIGWNELVKGDQRGTFHSDVTQIAEAADRLRRFTSDNQAVSGSGATENFNSAQLEECDMMTDDELSTVYWWNLAAQKTERHCDITGHQLLFCSRSSVGGLRTPQLCLRHDVDGILWTLDGKQAPHHTATFNAFAYVQASKTLRRWSGCSPDYSYAVICETNNHAFIYWQPNDVQSDLRNRKTSERVNQVARQQIISLKEKRESAGRGDADTSDSILAAVPTNQVLFLLTPAAVFAVSLK